MPHVGNTLRVRPTLFEFAGGEEAFLALARAGDMGDLGERFLDCFVRALNDTGLPGDPEFREAMHAYMRWAVHNVLSYSPEDAVVPSGERMPRWDWDGLRA